MRKNHNTRFIYISALEFCNVFITQVIDWLNLYQEQGVAFEIWRTSSLMKIFSRNERAEKKMIQTHYQGKVRKLYLAPARITVGFIFDTFLLIFLTAYQLILRRDLLIQTRSAELWKPLKYLKKISPKRVKIIFDSRGAVVEEIRYTYRNDPSFLISKLSRISNNEIKMIQLSDKIFCVSKVLIEYHLKRNPTLDKSKFYLYPCSSNSLYFYYSNAFRAQLRTQYHLEDKKVIVYSGGLNLSWHIPSKIFELFKGLHELDTSFFLMILSPDKGIAEKYLSDHCIPKESALIKSVPNDEMVKYLCAADIALLLRDDVPLNNVASPSKFAEYILTGLPVIISQNVGDFSNFVKENDLGYVVNNNFSVDILNNINSFLTNKAEEYSSRRHQIAELGLERYSKSKNLNEIIAQYHLLIP